MNQGFEKKKEFYSKRKNLEKIRDFIYNTLHQTPLQDDDIFRLQLAVDEACTNIIVHNYKEQDNKTINITVKLDAEKVSIIIEDEGDKFNPLNISAPDLNKHIREYRKHGLGIYLIRRLVDEIIYHYIKGKGNKLELVKYLEVYKLV